MTSDLPTLTEAKAQAKALRSGHDASATALTHARALEMIARQYGFRDWNAFHAAIKGRAPNGWETGGRVAGTYLSQPFQATVLDCQKVRCGWFRLVLDLDEPVDVVTSAAFSNLRKRIPIIVGPEGFTLERTSDGAPHAQLRM